MPHRIRVLTTVVYVVVLIVPVATAALANTG